MSGRLVLPLVMLGTTYGEKGDLNGCRAVYAELTGRALGEYVPSIPLAVLAARLGLREEAEQHVAQGVREREPLLVIYALGWRGTEPLRALRAFQQALAESGLPGWKPGAVGYRE